MGNCYSLYSKNLGMSGKMVWWSTEPNWSTKLGDLTECLKLTLIPIQSRPAGEDRYINVFINANMYQFGLYLQTFNYKRT